MNVLKYCKVYTTLLLIIVLLSVTVNASHNDSDEPPDKGFFDNIFGDLVDSVEDLPKMIINAVMDFVLEVVNAPISLLLWLIQSLMTEPIRIDIFQSIWKIIVYVFSFFFSILLVFCGFNFITSGHDVERREKSKTWLKNIAILIILLPASYFIYDTILGLNAGFTKLIVNQINPNFFLITADHWANTLLEIFFTIPYVIVLLLTCIVLIIRYAFVSAGVMLFPVGIFLYFITPLREYGKAIINFLMTNIFISFINAILLLTFSKIVELPIFGSFKILVIIAAFLIIQVTTLFALTFSLIKAALSIGKGVIAPIMKIGKYLL